MFLKFARRHANDASFIDVGLGSHILKLKKEAIVDLANSLDIAANFRPDHKQIKYLRLLALRIGHMISTYIAKTFQTSNIVRFRADNLLQHLTPLDGTPVCCFIDSRAQSWPQAISGRPRVRIPAVVGGALSGASRPHETGTGDAHTDRLDRSQLRRMPRQSLPLLVLGSLERREIISIDGRPVLDVFLETGTSALLQAETVHPSLERVDDQVSIRGLFGVIDSHDFQSWCWVFQDKFGDKIIWLHFIRDPGK